MHIHIKPFRFILSNKTQNRNKEEVEEQTQKGCRSSIPILRIPFLGQAFSSLTPNPSQICHYQITTQEKKNQLCIQGFLVRVDVNQIHLHLKNFLGTHELYFAHASFKKIISL